MEPKNSTETGQSILNPIIFAVCTVVILFLNKFIQNRMLSIPITVVAILGLVYAVYKSDMKKAAKRIIIGLYIAFLVLVFIFEFV